MEYTVTFRMILMIIETATVMYGHQTYSFKLMQLNQPTNQIKYCVLYGANSISTDVFFNKL